jgi:hypothetical protein
MKVQMVHLYSDVTIDEFVVHFFSPEFNAEVAKRLDVEGREEIERNEDEQGIHRVLKTVIPKNAVPAPVLRLLGVPRLEFTEEHRYRRGSSVIGFRTVPNVFPGRAAIDGEIVFEILPDGRLQRRIEGEVDVRVFGIGRIVERVIRDNVKRANQTIAEVMEEWLRTHSKNRARK